MLCRFFIFAAAFPLAFSGFLLAGWFFEILIFLGCGPALLHNSARRFDVRHFTLVCKTTL